MDSAIYDRLPVMHLTLERRVKHGDCLGVRQDRLTLLADEHALGVEGPKIHVGGQTERLLHIEAACYRTDEAVDDEQGRTLIH